jgi:hypothetical protein
MKPKKLKSEVMNLSGIISEKATGPAVKVVGNPKGINIEVDYHEDGVAKKFKYKYTPAVNIPEPTTRAAKVKKTVKAKTTAKAKKSKAAPKKK